LPGLGSSGRLTYHEAFVAQGAREILVSDNWAHPTIGGLPWLEKPPLPWWLVAVLARCTGGVNEIVARFPSALAAMVLSFGVAGLARRHYGSRVGLLAGAVQATTVWTVVRGRLAEADILLASLITWAMFAFDSMVNLDGGEAEESTCMTSRCNAARWAFFVLLGMTSLVKGIGFGAVMILAVVAGILAWQRSGAAVRRSSFRTGWVVAAVISVAWPLLIVAQHGSRALMLWTMHVADRVAGQTGPGPFAGEPWWEYTLGLLGQALPWTPFAVAGGWGSLSRLVLRRSHVDSCQVQDRIPAIILAGDRLLWTWATIPLGLLALAAVKNAHYAISAQVPWSIWAALSLNQLGERLRLRGWGQRSLRLAPRVLFATLAVVYGLGYWLIGPWFDRRGLEWAFYESVGRQVSSDVPLALLYDDWDRNPYESSFGPIPHDLAVRLFYLGRPACWHIGAESLSTCDHHCVDGPPVHLQVMAEQASPCPSRLVFSVIGRDRDLPVLERLGSVKVLGRGPNIRFDRTYLLFQVTSALKQAGPQPGLALSPYVLHRRANVGCEYGTADLW
jgi:4-amino-4-deoxy-L-arabinose transferase-like glycosyltransferase